MEDAVRHERGNGNSLVSCMSAGCAMLTGSGSILDAVAPFVGNFAGLTRYGSEFVLLLCAVLACLVVCFRLLCKLVGQNTLFFGCKLWALDARTAKN